MLLQRTLSTSSSYIHCWKALAKAIDDEKFVELKVPGSNSPSQCYGYFLVNEFHYINMHCSMSSKGKKKKILIFCRFSQKIEQIMTSKEGSHVRIQEVLEFQNSTYYLSYLRYRCRNSKLV